MLKKAFALLGGLASLAGALSADSSDPGWGWAVSPYASIPLGTGADFLGPGAGLRASGGLFVPGANLAAGLAADYGFFPAKYASSSLSVISAGPTLGVQWSPATALSLGVGASGGWYYAQDNQNSALAVSNGWWDAQAAAAWGFSSGWALTTGVGYRSQLGLTGALTITLTVGTQPSQFTTPDAGMQIPGGYRVLSRLKTGFQAAGVRSPDLLPVLLRSYDAKPVVALLFHNYEKFAVDQLRVTIDWTPWSGGPQVLRMPAQVGPGLELASDLPLAWGPSFWTAPEPRQISGTLRMSYNQGGRQFKAEQPITLSVKPRSTTPDDPNLWPAFASLKDSSVVAWTKAVPGRSANLLPAELGTAAAVQAGLDASKITVLAPRSTLQFIHDTLTTRQGTARDWALAWATLGAAQGLETALVVNGSATLPALAPTNPATVLSWLPGASSLTFADRTWIVFDPTAGPSILTAAKTAADFPVSGATVVPLAAAWKANPPADPPGAAAPPPASAAWAAGLKTSLDGLQSSGTGAMLATLKAQAEAAAKADQPTLYNRLGVAYARAGQWDQALETFKRQATLGSKAALVNLGHVYLLTGQPKAALDPYLAALKTNASDATILTGLALASRALGDATTRKNATARLTQLDKAQGARVAALPAAAAPGDQSQWASWLEWRE